MHDNQKNIYIQGSRGLFALMVFVYHVHNSGLNTYDIFKYDFAVFAFDMMQHGVELFFGISGIVIVGSLFRSSSISMFVLDRITRIYPVLWATVFAVTVVSVVVSGHNVTIKNFFFRCFPHLPFLNPM